jgi:hypothetical protein
MIIVRVHACSLVDASPKTVEKSLSEGIWALSGRCAKRRDMPQATSLDMDGVWLDI